MYFEILVAIILLQIGISWFKKISCTSNELPPGPRGFPVLGHLPSLGRNPHRKLLEWKKDYGPMMTLRFGSYRTVVLNDVKVIKEAFSLPSFSGRAQLKAFVDIAQNRGMSFSEGVANTEQRHFVMRNLKNFTYGRTNECKIQEEITGLLDCIRMKIKQNSRIEVTGIFSASATNVFCSTSIGERFQLDDPQINHFSYLVGEKITRSDTFLSKLALFLPWLNTILPRLCGYYEKIGSYQEIFDYVEDRLDKRRKTWVKNQPRDLTDSYFDKVQETFNTDSSFHASRGFQVRTTSDLLIAAVETTSTTLEWTVWLLARYPHVQRKLQAEIDKVVGTGRLPSLNDRQQMPYADAVLQEVGRFASVIPLGVFRRTLVDVHFNGYRIPKDTVVVSNLYGVHHDPTLGDPENFRPERYLKPESGGDDAWKHARELYMPFSYGKRSCPGEALSKDQLYLFVTALFQSFSMELPLGETRTPEATFGMTLKLLPFQLEFRQRK